MLKFSWQEDLRKDTEPELLSKVPDAFGVATLAGSWEAVYQGVDRITTHIYLPQDEDEAIKCHWNIFKRDRPVPEPRCFVCLLVETEGEDLVRARRTWDLLESIMHALLGAPSHFDFALISNKGYCPLGWLNIYQA